VRAARCPEPASATPLSANGSILFLDLVYRIGGRIAPSQRYYTRCRRLYRSFSIQDIRRSRDIPALEACERLLSRARRPGDVPAGRGLQRELTRAEIAAFLVETRNRLNALLSGRADRPRPKGPRFDPARIPERRSSASSGSIRTSVLSIACGPNASGTWRNGEGIALPSLCQSRRQPSTLRSGCRSGRKV
jgi:hypothetical protein